MGSEVDRLIDAAWESGFCEYCCEAKFNIIEQLVHLLANKVVSDHQFGSVLFDVVLRRSDFPEIGASGPRPELTVHIAEYIESRGYPRVSAKAHPGQ